MSQMSNLMYAITDCPICGRVIGYNKCIFCGYEIEVFDKSDTTITLE